MSRHRLIALAASFACLAIAGEMKKLTLDLSKAPEGDPPSEVFVIDGTIRVATKDRSKVLEVDPAKPEIDAGAVIGASANGAAGIQVRVLATKSGRSYPRFGIGIHGQTGCRLMIVPAKKEIQLVKNDEVIRTAPFEWSSGTWVKLSLAAKPGANGSWIVTAKAWPADAAEPAEPQIKHEDSSVRAHGQCSIWATPYSGTPIDFTDIAIEVES